MSRNSVCFTLLLLAACAGADETALQEPELGAAGSDGAAEPVLIDTIVTVAPDGTVTETLQQVTAAERAAQERARSAALDAARDGERQGAPPAELGQSRAALSVNPSCASADLWL